MRKGETELGCCWALSLLFGALWVCACGVVARFVFVVEAVLRSLLCGVVGVPS